MEITAIGGYDEIGKNMTVIAHAGEAIVLDMGLHVERLMGEDYDLARMSRAEMLNLGAIPNYKTLDDIKAKMVGVFIGHAHLDHVGAAGKMAGLFKGIPFYMTPFTAAVFNQQIEDDQKYKGQRPDVRIVQTGTKVSCGQNFVVEFIAVAHSIPDAAVLAVHTPKGVFLYALDWKFDPTPLGGSRTNIGRLEQLGAKGNVIGMAFDTTRIERTDPTKSEKWAKEKIDETIAGLKGEGIIATTFASHIVRLQTLIEAGKRQGRQVYLLGRSMDKYVGAAKELKLIELRKATVWGRPRSIEAVLSKIRKNKEDYMLIVTGNQGEPGSVLDRMVRGVLPYHFDGSDNVLFCSEAIPTPVNLACRKEIEQRIKGMGSQVHLGLHVSGHASGADIAKFIQIVKPKNLFPTHGGLEKLIRARKLGLSIGYKPEQIHLLHDGETFRLN
jgi:ribonuclease J